MSTVDVESRTVSIDAALLREFVVEALTVEEILIRIGGRVSPSAIGGDLDRLACEVAAAAGFAPEDYFADGMGGVGLDAEPYEAWKVLEAEAEAGADEFMGVAS